MPIVHDRDGDAHIQVWVVPGANRSEIKGVHGDALRIRVASPAAGGAANRDLISLLRVRLGTEVAVVRGVRSRRKTLVAKGIDADDVARKLGLDVR